MQDQSGATPLHVAVDLEGDAAWQSGEPPKTTLTKLLLDLGADPQIANKEGKTPADVAREYNHLGALSMLGR
jgi:ankyrin repeat protein